LFTDSSSNVSKSRFLESSTGPAGNRDDFGARRGANIEKHGIVAGMSGSPVYIDGKIIGALAYGFMFAYRPIAGITPIEDMLPILDLLDDGRSPRGRRQRFPGLAGIPVIGMGLGTEWDCLCRVPAACGGRPSRCVLSPARPKWFGNWAEPLSMTPLVSPFFVTGMSPASAGDLRDFFRRGGLSLMPAGSSGGSNEQPSEPSPPLVAGSALAIPVMTGDLSIAATGTATYRSAATAFLPSGIRPFRGATRAPMSQAYMIAFMQSYMLSFKLGESREIVGTVSQDKEFGIGGVSARLHRGST
jgi:hypothetical protein